MAAQGAEMVVGGAGSGAYREWKGWEPGAFGQCDAIAARYFDREFARAGIGTGADAAILEIGFGNGSFAAWAHARGCEYTGTELDPELVQRARQHGWRAFPAVVDLGSLSMPVAPTCIVALDVLEHLAIDDIATLLESAARLLRPGGALIARVPSGDSPFARHIQHGDISHRTILGASAVGQLAAQAGLRVAQVRAPVLPLLGLGARRWLRRVPLLAGRALVATGIRVLFHDGQPTVIAPNMLVVLRAPGALP